MYKNDWIGLLDDWIIYFRYLSKIYKKLVSIYIKLN